MIHYVWSRNLEIYIYNRLWGDAAIVTLGPHIEKLPEQLEAFAHMLNINLG